MARIIDAFAQFFDNDGEPLSGGKLRFTDPGTMNDKATFSDSAETTQNANPVILDANGRCPSIFGTGAYRVTSYTSVDVQVQQFDPVGVDTSDQAQFGEWGSGITYDMGDYVVDGGILYRSLVNGNINNDPTSSPASWEELKIGRVWNSNVTYSATDSAYGSNGTLYFSLVGSNLNNNPTSSPASWRPMYQVPYAAAGGTADIITATFTPAFTSYFDGMELRVRALLENATTTPTINVNGLGAKGIKKNGGDDLLVGCISGPDHEMILRFNSTLDSFEFLNPKSPAMATTAEMEAGTSEELRQMSPKLVKDAIDALSAGYKKIDEWTPTAVNSKDFTWADSYISIMIIGTGLGVADDSTSVRGRFGHSDAATIFTSGYTGYTGRLNNPGDADTLSHSAYIPLIVNATGTVAELGVGNGSDEGFGFKITLSGASSVVSPPMYRGEGSGRSNISIASASRFNGFIDGADPATNVVESFRLYLSGGNFKTQGKVYIFGLEG